MKITNATRKFFLALSLAFLAVMIAITPESVNARPVTKKGGSPAPQVFYRQRNTLSNLDFYYTNKGILFNNDVGEGLFYPRGTTNFYIFGGGLWFATKKNIAGKRRKLCELGYNPNSGVGWFTEGEINDPDNGGKQQKYTSYVSPRYDKTTGRYIGGLNSTIVQPAANWPIWDTSATKTLTRNYYFGDYISKVDDRETLAKLATDHKPLPNGKIPAPAMLSQEEIVNIYTDQTVTANPEYRVGTGYPFNLNIVEVIYSWSFGKYRDMIFVRRKITNASLNDTLYECFMSGAFDPDLGGTAGDEQNDDNSFFGLTKQDSAFCRTPYFWPDSGKRAFNPNAQFYSNPFALNMGYQWKTKPVGGKQFGVIGFTFLESPVTTPNGTLIDISDSDAIAAAKGGYCDLTELGLNTFRRWSIANDPPTPDLRYDFQASGSKDGPLGAGADQRMLFSTGPFTLPPQKPVEYVLAIAIAAPDINTLQNNKDSCVRLIAFAHHIFSDTTGSYHRDSNGCNTVVKSFVTPGPPEIPTLHTSCLDRGVLVQWDTLSDSSKNPLSTTLAFNTYDLYRTTRSDHDSTIRPDGINPTVHIGSWSIWNFRQDSTFDTVKVGTLRVVKFAGFKFTRTNTVPNILPHSFLDVGDDNRDGVITGNEGLYNSVQYYYFLLATNEYDSINKIGPLTTAIVAGKNFAVGIPCKPIFPDIPNVIAGDSGCLNGAVAAVTGSLPSSGTKVSIDVLDTGKFIQLYSNDTIYVSFQPRWTEYANVNILNTSPLNMFVDVTENRQGKVLTYDKLYNPTASPVLTPYSYPTGIFQQIIGQTPNPNDSNVSGKFTTNNTTFAPYETIDQAFDIAVDFQMKQLASPYAIHSITTDPAKIGIISISNHTSTASSSWVKDYNNLDTVTRPSFQGSLGEDSYEITFGGAVPWSEEQLDNSGKVITLNHLKDTTSGADFHPMALPVTITSSAHCGQALSVIRAGNGNDVAVENDNFFYHTPFVQDKVGAPFHPDYTRPDTMIVPLAGKFAIDAFHFTEDNDGDNSTANPFLKTTGMYYFRHDAANFTSNKYLETVHRLRLGGAEIILNFPGISNSVTGDSTTTYQSPNSPTAANDFQPGDKITVSFVGLMKGLPFPGAKFMIETNKGKTFNFSDNSLYQQSKILSEVQVVPNPYIVEHIGQTSTDNAKLFFTRLPPTATIEIYNIAGELVKTLHHNGYATKTNANNVVTYDYPNLADRYNVETWNLLSEGLQRVGSQVFVARIIALDPQSGAEIAETTTKFAVVLGGFHITH